MKRMLLLGLAVMVSAAWANPVPGPVERGYEPPAGPYGPGHRGVDFRAEPGSEVSAAASGTVSFAGSVAGSLHVTVRHPGEVFVTYSYLSSLAVAAADPVEAGTVVGRSGGTGPDHAPDVVHVGVRAGGSYVDPLTFFGGENRRRVRLIPLAGPSPCRAGDRKSVPGAPLH